MTASVYRATAPILYHGRPTYDSFHGPPDAESSLPLSRPPSVLVGCITSKPWDCNYELGPCLWRKSVRSLARLNPS